MPLNPSVILASNISLRSYESNGVHRHSHPVEVYQSLSYTVNLNPLPSNTPVKFVIPTHLQLLSLLIGSSASSLTNATISLSILDNNITSSLVIPILDVSPANGSIAFVDFPFLVLNPESILTIRASFEFRYLTAWTKEIYAEPPILGQI